MPAHSKLAQMNDYFMIQFSLFPLSSAQKANRNHMHSHTYADQVTNNNDTRHREWVSGWRQQQQRKKNAHQIDLMDSTILERTEWLYNIDSRWLRHSIYGVLCIVRGVSRVNVSSIWWMVICFSTVCRWLSCFELSCCVDCDWRHCHVSNTRLFGPFHLFHADTDPRTLFRLVWCLWW